jgi:hypothetical protein
VWACADFAEIIPWHKTTGRWGVWIMSAPFHECTRNYLMMY